MDPMMIERRQLLQGGFGVLLGLISSASLADVLVTDNATVVEGDGPLAAQLRLGELLIRYLAGQKDTGTRESAGANVVVSPASLAAILSFVDLGGSNRMHAAIHRALGFRTEARRQGGARISAPCGAAFPH